MTPKICTHLVHHTVDATVLDTRRILNEGGITWDKVVAVEAVKIFMPNTACHSWYVIDVRLATIVDMVASASLVANSRATCCSQTVSRSTPSRGLS